VHCPGFLVFDPCAAGNVADLHSAAAEEACEFYVLLEGEREGEGEEVGAEGGG